MRPSNENKNYFKSIYRYAFKSNVHAKRPEVLAGALLAKRMQCA